MVRHGLIREHRDFRRLWIGETVSQFGSQVSVLAVPLIGAGAAGASEAGTGGGDGAVPRPPPTRPDPAKPLVTNKFRG